MNSLLEHDCAWPSVALRYARPSAGSDNHPDCGIKSAARSRVVCATQIFLSIHRLFFCGCEESRIAQAAHACFFSQLQENQLSFFALAKSPPRVTAMMFANL
jgi:hypothetical protein